MEEPVKKRVDESWKEQAQREKHVAPQPPSSGPGTPVTPSERTEPHATPAGQLEARFDLLISSLAMEAFVALGDMPHPTTRKPSVNLPQARYLIDLLGILEEKTTGNRSVDEDRLLKDALYQLRMRYLSKTGGSVQ